MSTIDSPTTSPSPTATTAPTGTTEPTTRQSSAVDPRVIADFDPTDFHVAVPRWRRLLDHMGITGSTVKPRWRLNAELARFVVEHPNMSNDQRDLVAYAKEVESADVDSAWTALNTAKRIELGRIVDETERQLKATALLAEANEKLTGWRKHASQVALGDGAQDDAVTPAVEALVLVQAHLDEHNDNRYRQLAIHARSLRYIGSLVVALLVAFGLVIAIGDLTLPTQLTNEDGTSVRSLLADFDSYLLVIVLGAMGALLSVFMSRISGPDANPLKDLGNRVSSYVRPLLGGLSAVVVVLVLESGVQNVVTLGKDGLLVGALLAGFSERLIDRALSGIAD